MTRRAGRNAAAARGATKNSSARTTTRESSARRKASVALVMHPLLAPIAKAFARDPAVVAKTMFASVALTVKGQIFAMVDSKGRFVVKLSAARVASLIGSGAMAWPGDGRVMKQWVALPAGDSSSWLALAKEARDFVMASVAR